MSPLSPGREADSSTTGPAWAVCDLDSIESRKVAIAATRDLIPRAQFGAMAYDVEWRLGPEPDWASVLALVYRDGSGRSGYAPFFRQERPLELHFGEIKWASFDVDRLTLNGPPILPEVPRDELVRITLSLLDAVDANRAPTESVYFEGLPVDSVAYELITGYPAIAGRFVSVPLGAPYEHQFAQLPETYEAYLGQLGSRSRQSVQYSERKLEKQMAGTVRTACFDTEESVERFLADGAAVSRRTYQWNLLGLGLRDTPALRSQLRMAAQRGWFRSYILYCREQPVAFMLGYQYAGCYYYTDVGYDPDYAKWSVGSVLQLKVMQHLYSRDDRRPLLFDFSTGYGSHKARFGNVARREANVLLLPRTLTNRLKATAFLVNERASLGTAALLERVGVKARVKKLLRGIAGTR